MDKEALVDRDIDEGRRLVQALDEAGFPIVAALWSFFPEADEWRLMIASPKVRELGPLAAYQSIQEVLLRSPLSLRLYHVSAVDPDEPLVTELRVFAGTDPAPFLGGTYLRKEVVGGIYVEGAYVYRAERIVGQSGTLDLWVMTRDKARKVWTARRGKIILEGGFLKQIEVEGFDWPQTHKRDGVSARLKVLAYPKDRGGETFGDVQRWTFLGGRLRGVETFARGVRVEGYSASPSAESAVT